MGSPVVGGTVAGFLAPVLASCSLLGVVAAVLIGWRWLLVTVYVWCTVKEVGCYELSNSSVGAGGLLVSWLVGSSSPSPATEPFPPVMLCA